jgi:hypothetical protein
VMVRRAGRRWTGGVERRLRALRKVEGSRGRGGRGENSLLGSRSGVVDVAPSKEVMSSWREEKISTLCHSLLTHARVDIAGKIIKPLPAHAESFHDIVWLSQDFLEDYYVQPGALQLATTHFATPIQPSTRSLPD